MKNDAKIARELEFFKESLDKGDSLNAVQHFLAARALFEEESSSEAVQHLVRESTTKMNQHPDCSDIILQKISKNIVRFKAISHLNDIVDAKKLLLETISAYNSLGSIKKNDNSGLIADVKKHITDNADNWMRQLIANKKNMASGAEAQFSYIKDIISAAGLTEQLKKQIATTQKKMDKLEMATTIDAMMRSKHGKDSVNEAFCNMIKTLETYEGCPAKERISIIEIAYQLVKSNGTDDTIQEANLAKLKQKAMTFERSPSLKEKNIARLMSIFMAVLRIFTNKKDEYRFFPPKKVDTPVSQSMKTLEHKLEDRSKQAKKS